VSIWNIYLFDINGFILLPGGLIEYFIGDFSVKGGVAHDVGEGLEKTKVQVMVVGRGPSR
jgi:hypothetical protein